MMMTFAKSYFSRIRKQHCVAALESSSFLSVFNVSFQLAKSTWTTKHERHIVVTHRAWYAISVPIDTSHCISVSTTAALLHITCNLTSKAPVAKGPTKADCYVIAAVKHSRVPVT